MSFNIRFGTAADGENAWPMRREAVAKTLSDFDPDMVGIQEALDFQLHELEALVPDMARFGVGRDDGETEGEYAPILYRIDRLELVDRGTFWFSDTPEVPGSMSWGNEIPRICTWGRFRDRRSGRTFLLFNLHWDHRSQPSREEGAGLLVERIEILRGPDEPVVITGDFNAGEDNPAFLRVMSAPGLGLEDPFRVLHPDETGVGTYHGFRGGKDGEKIDAVLASFHWTVVDAGIVRDRVLGRYPSDHYPVTAVLALDDPGRDLAFYEIRDGKATPRW